MDLPTIDLRDVKLPSPAGDLQRRGETASLIRELGDNYAKYHAFLASALDRLGGRPDPSKLDSYEAFVEAWSPLESIVHAEATLRRCRAMRKAGKALDAGLDLSIPLVDENDRLVSAE